MLNTDKVLTNRGAVQCRILLSATGALHKPVLPDIDGCQDFRGETNLQPIRNLHFTF